MKLVKKVEELVFNSGVTSNIEIVKNRSVIISSTCVIEHFTDSECVLQVLNGVRYEIFGVNLSVREYGDMYIRIESDGISQLIIGDKDGDLSEE